MCVTVGGRKTASNDLQPRKVPSPMYLDESQGVATIESIIFNMCDGTGYCNPYQGYTINESIFLDASNGRMKDDFRDIFRDSFISVDSRCEVRNILRWHVSMEVETIRPTSIFISPRDCEGPSLHRESESIPPPPSSLGRSHVPCVEYHVGMWKLNIYTVAIGFRNDYDNHGYRCNGWILDKRVYL